MSIFDRFLSSRPAANPPGPVAFCVCCLGNPGVKYDGTRHNAGFMTADLIAEQKRIQLNRLKFKAVCGEAEHDGAKILILKPQTFMNSSGESAREVLAWYKLPPERLIVVCDDLELPCGKIRIRAKGSDGGHNGLKSIIAQIGSDAFPRVRIGIGRPQNPEYPVVDYVLGRFTAEESKPIGTAVQRAAAAVFEIVSSSPEQAAAHFNGLRT